METKDKCGTNVELIAALSVCLHVDSFQMSSLLGRRIGNGSLSGLQVRPPIGATILIIFSQGCLHWGFWAHDLSVSILTALENFVSIFFFFFYTHGVRFLQMAL